MRPHLRCCDFLLVLGERGGWGGGGKTSSSKRAPPVSRSDPEKERFRCDLRCAAAAAAAEEEEELLWEPKEVLRSALPPVPPPTPEASDEVEGPREPHEISSTRESLQRSNYFRLCRLHKVFLWEQISRKHVSSLLSVSVLVVPFVHYSGSKSIPPAGIQLSILMLVQQSSIVD